MDILHKKPSESRGSEASLYNKEESKLFYSSEGNYADRKVAPFRDSGVRPKKGRVLSLFCPKKPINGKKSPGKFCHRIFNPGIKWSQKSWNFLPSKEKNPGIFSNFFSWIPWKIGIPGIFWSQNFPSCNILSGNFLSWDFISRKILAFYTLWLRTEHRALDILSKPTWYSLHSQ